MPTQRDAYLQKWYSITEKEYARVLRAQGGGCAVCGRKGVTRSLHVDHDHRSGVVRGILCPRHNAGLQKFQDDPEFLRAAAQYLDDPPAVRLLGERQAAKRKRRRKRRRKSAGRSMARGPK